MGKRCSNQLSQIDIKAFAAPTSRQFDITLFTFEDVYYASTKKQSRQEVLNNCLL